MASQGYPGAYEKGYAITGWENIAGISGAMVFQAGTRAEGEAIVTAGGRVLAVQAHGTDLEEALARAYAGVDALQFEGKTFRRDIGQKGLARLAS